jgi:putative MATE family efflux protein
MNAEASIAEGSIWRHILKLAWPALIQQGLLLTIQLYDQYLAGPFSEPHKAALTNANYVYWFVTSYTVVVNAGATALVGRLIGGQDLPLARKATGQALLLALFFGLLGTVISWAGGLWWLVWALSLSPEGSAYAVEYLLPLAGLLPFYMIEVGGVACLIGAGDTRTGLKVLTTAAILNVPLAWALSRGFGPIPALGFVGIAWGTGLSHVVGAIFVIVTLIRGRYGLLLRWPDLIPDISLITRHLRVSLPAALDSLSVGFFQFVFLRVVNDLGETATSAHGIAIRLEGLGYLSGAAFGTAAVSIVSRSLGMKRPDLAARGAWSAFGLGMLVMTLMGVIFFSCARLMFEVFCPNPADEPVINAGVPVLRLVAFAMPILASTIVLTAALRGAGDTRVPAVITWVGFLGVRLPLAYYLTRPELGLGLFGAWIAMVADLYVRGGLILWRFSIGRWKSIRV